jgi:hypothetical protein
MRIKEFLFESAGGNMLIKNGLTYLPLASWLKQELGDSPDTEMDEAFGKLNAPGKEVSDTSIGDFLKTIKDEQLLKITKEKLNPNNAKFKNNPKKYNAAVERKQAAIAELEKRDIQPTNRSPEQYKKDFITKPHVHATPIKFIDNGTEVDVEHIRNIILQRPAEILGSNAKMDHSGGVDQVYFKVGLPALRGMAIDEETGKFIYVNTCPGAGSCKVDCFAKKGNYVVFPGVWQHSTQVLNYLINDPDGFMQQLHNEILKKVKLYEPQNIKVGIRWHDSGDFFSPEYADMAYKLARSLPNVDFFAYTKFASAMTADKPDNFITNWSEGATPAQDKAVASHAAELGDKFKRSIIVPKEAFKHLVHKVTPVHAKGKKNEVLQSEWNSPEAEQEFKQWMAHAYNLPIESIISYNDLVKMPKTNEPKWNVIVKTGDGDISANRRDVIGTYLFAH